MKLAVIGGASSYTPELIDGLFSRLEEIPVTEVWMMDVNGERLSITADFSRRMGERHGNPFRIYETGDLVEAVRDASYVVTQIRVGGSAARIEDEKLGLRHNIVGQETTGVGGFACALRTIPRILEVAEAMEDWAPGGVLINFTNPAGIVTEAVLKHSGIVSVGLCNIPIGIVMEVKEVVGCSMEEVSMDYVGLNHLSWVRQFMVGDRDVTEEVLGAFLAKAGEEWEVEAVCADMCAAMRRLGMFCNYYLQYYYSTESALADLQGREKTRGEEVVDIEEALFAKYASEDVKEKPAELSQRGGAHYSTAAFYLMDGIENDRGNRQVVCCRNGGAIPTLADDVCVEVSAVIDKGGAHALAVAAPEASIGELLEVVKAYESLTVEAAVTGDREAALGALVEHPLLPGEDECGEILDELLTINRDYLLGTFF